MNYKFKPDDKVTIASYVGTEVDCVIYSVYASDKENHCAAPHNRYVCYEENWKGSQVLFHLHDVSENELVMRP